MTWSWRQILIAPTLEAAIRETRDGWIAALILSLLPAADLLLSLLHVVMGRGPIEFSLPMVLNVTVTLLLAFGVYRKSRTASVLLFAFWLVPTLSSILQGDFWKTIVGLVFLYFFFYGIRGSFSFHYLQKEEAEKQA